MDEVIDSARAALQRWVAGKMRVEEVKGVAAQVAGRTNFGDDANLAQAILDVVGTESHVEQVLRCLAAEWGLAGVSAGCPQE